MGFLQATTSMFTSLPHERLFAVLVILTLAYFTLNAIYRLTIHPLAKYPGPLLHRLSIWPTILDCRGGHRHLRLLSLHEKYGPIVRTAPNHLSLNTISALYAINADRNANVFRDEWYKTVDIASGAYSTQSCMDKNEHAFRRRIISQAFSERALREAEGFIRANVKRFCERLGGYGVKEAEGGWSKERNMADEATYFGFDFISDLTFGEAFGLMADGEGQGRYIPSTLMWASRFISYVGYLPFRAMIRALMGTPLQAYLGDPSAASSLQYARLANARLADRVALEEAAQSSGKPLRRDVFHYILNARDPVTGLGFTREELQADAGLLLSAGSDGVALTLSACVFYLLRNPATYERLVTEIRSAFESEQDIKTPKLNNMPYLMACIQETMRMTPPIPSILPRVVLPGGVEVPSTHPVDDDGVHVHIPAGTTVGVAPYTIHHNPRYYPDPWTFQPHRWIVSDTSTPGSVALARKAYCPFSMGSMDCVGKNMAYLALKLALANMLFKFDLRLSQGGRQKRSELLGSWGLTSMGGGDLEAKKEGRRRDGEYQIVDFVVGYRDGPLIEVRRRG